MAGGCYGRALLAGFGDACLLDASGENGEDDVEGERDLPRSYPLSASFCSESAKNKKEINKKI